MFDCFFKSKIDRINETVYTRVQVKRLGENKYVVQKSYKSLPFESVDYQGNKASFSTEYYETFEEADEFAKKLFEEDNKFWREYHLEKCQDLKYEGVVSKYE